MWQNVPGQPDQMQVYYHIVRKLSSTCLGGPSGGTFLASTMRSGHTTFRGALVPCFRPSSPPRLVVIKKSSLTLWKQCRAADRNFSENPITECAALQFLQGGEFGDCRPHGSPHVSPLVCAGRTPDSAPAPFYLYCVTPYFGVELYHFLKVGSF